MCDALFCFMHVNSCHLKLRQSLFFLFDSGFEVLWSLNSLGVDTLFFVTGIAAFKWVYLFFCFSFATGLIRVLAGFVSLVAVYFNATGFIGFLLGKWKAGSGICTFNVCLNWKHNENFIRYSTHFYKIRPSNISFYAIFAFDFTWKISFFSHSIYFFVKAWNLGS